LLSREQARGWKKQTDAVVRLLIVAVPTGAVLLVYLLRWGALVPPGISQALNHFGLFLPSWLHAIAFLGLASIVFVPVEAVSFRDFLRNVAIRRWLLVVVLAVVAMWLACDTTYSGPDGRFGSVIWSLSQRTPAFGRHSPAVLVLAIMGAVFSLWIGTVVVQIGTVPAEAAALALVCVGLGFTQAAYQRYMEPITYLSLGCFFARIARPNSRQTRRYVPIIALGVLQVIAVAQRLYF
jgi:hypothetical protein